MKDVIAYVVLDARGNIALLDDGALLILKSKKEAKGEVALDEGETIQKVRITEA